MESSTKEKLKDWVIAQNTQLGRANVSVSDDTPLLEQGLVSSLDLVQLIQYLEELRGKPISSSQLKPSAFRDINTIFKTFFTEGLKS